MKKLFSGVRALTPAKPHDRSGTSGPERMPYSMCSLSTTPINRLFLKYRSDS